jgi:putative DNA primase/helicase
LRQCCWCDPFADILANRGAYVSAALIIVRAYLVAGKPGCLPPIASFRGWSDLVRSALVWLGCDDPADSMEAARAEDPELADLTEMLQLWITAFGAGSGITLRDAVKQAGQHGKSQMGEPTEPQYPDLLEAMQRASGGKGGIDTRSLGKWLLSREGRPVAGYRFQRFGTASGGIIRWGVNPLTN